jgi:hypothetical protein
MNSKRSKMLGILMQKTGRMKLDRSSRQWYVLASPHPFTS